MNWVLRVHVSHLLHLLELRLVFDLSLVLDRLALLRIVYLTSIHPESLVVLIESLDVVLIELIDAAVDLLDALCLLIVEVLLWEDFLRFIAKPLVEGD